MNIPMTERPAVPSLSHNIEQVKEAERRRIARALHDELGGQLTGIKMALAQLRQQLHSPKAAALTTDFLDTLTDGAINAMHSIIDELHPAALDLGLPAALEWLAKTSSQQSGVAHELSSDTAWPMLDAFSTVSLYRIAREALHNVARHAAAGKVQILLRHTPEQLLMEIIDDGTGLPPHAAEAAQSSGIRGMHARATAMGATLQLLPGVHGGVKLQVIIPLAVLNMPKL